MCPYELLETIYLSIKGEHTECMREILKYYALEKPSRKYKVEQAINSLRKKQKEKGFSHGLVIKVFNDLMKSGYIEGGTKVTWRTGKQTCAYQLTFKGLSIIYEALGPEKWYGNVEFPKKHSLLMPLIFGKWDHFERNGVAKVAEKHLDLAFRNYPTLDEVYEAFFLTKPSVDAEIADKWMEALREDLDVRNWITDRIKVKLGVLYEKKNGLESMLMQISQ